MERVGAHISEDISRARAHEFFSRLGWVANDLHRDYGEDMIVTVFRDGLATPIHFFVQIKSTQSAEKAFRPRFNGFAVPLRTSLVKKWRDSAVAIFVLLFDQTREIFYWDYIQHLVQDEINTSRKSLTIHISKDRVLSPEHAGELEGYARHRLEGYQRMARAEREFQAILIDDYGMRVNLGLSAENVTLPCGHFRPSKSGDSLIYLLGGLGKKMVASRAPRRSIRKMIDTQSAIIDRLEAGEALLLPDPITRMVTEFTSLEPFLDRMRRMSLISLSP